MQVTLVQEISEAYEVETMKKSSVLWVA